MKLTCKNRMRCAKRILLASTVIIAAKKLWKAPEAGKWPTSGATASQAQSMKSIHNKTVETWEWPYIHELIGTTESASDASIQAAVKEWQRAQDVGLTLDGKIGQMTLGLMRLFYLPETDRRVLDDAEKQEIARLTASYESGGRYNAINPDMEYEGRWDEPRRHASYKNGKEEIPIADRKNYPGFKPFWASKYNSNGGAHVGISYGLIQFTQDSGSLGDVLKWFHERDPSSFNEVFGGKTSAQKMLAMVTRSGASSKNQRPRGVRVQKIDGADLWESPWKERFQRAGHIPAMQWAQHKKLITSYLDPAVEEAFKVGFFDRACINVLFDFCTHGGRGGMRDATGAGLAKYGGRAPNRAAILDVIRAYKNSSKARQDKVRLRRVRMIVRHDLRITYK